MILYVPERKKNMINEERINEISKLDKKMLYGPIIRNTSICFLPASIMLTGGGILVENNFIALLGGVSTLSLIGLSVKGHIDQKHSYQKIVKIFKERESKHE